MTSIFVCLFALGDPGGGVAESHGMDVDRLRIETFWMAGVLVDGMERMCDRTDEPTNPVAPVRIRWTMVEESCQRQDEHELI